jgi:hypothetical protein
MLNIDKTIYEYMNDLAPMLNLWVAIFFLFTLIRIGITLVKPSKKITYSSVLSELPGLPLTLLHTVCFIKAIYAQDIISAALFIWWGPGFILIAMLYIYIKLRKVNFNWAPLGWITSVACKLNYLFFVIVYFYFGCYEIITAFSIWIIHDQINLAWFANNADRTRRLTEDHWLIRICYLAFLFLPIFVLSFSYRFETLILTSALFVFWALAIIKVIRKGYFKVRPPHEKFLRNIIYLAKK